MTAHYAPEYMFLCHKGHVLYVVLVKTETESKSMLIGTLMKWASLISFLLH